MRPLSFQIKNFRSILDTGAIYFSMDGITAIVGQNESGKTAILEALAKTFSNQSIADNDLRHGHPLPEIFITTELTEIELSSALTQIEDSHTKNQLLEQFKNINYKLNWHFSFHKNSTDPKIYDSHWEIENINIAESIVKIRENIELAQKNANSKEISEISADSQEHTSPSPELTNSTPEAINQNVEEISDKIRDKLFKLAPTFVLFEEKFGLLPNSVDITDENQLAISDGKNAAENFLVISKIDLSDLVKSDPRAREATLKSANKKLTEEFRKFWSQTIGTNSKLEIQCSIHHYPTGNEKTGKPYLQFLISDSSDPLYPQQRSRGTRWFISFFLQLFSSQIQKKNLIFLLDEPGANLHEKAQRDVLKLLESIKNEIGVIYSTHSPNLISETHFQRILAVERDEKEEGNPTKVIGAHALGAASSDTLSPILASMGASFSRQTTIKSTNNVILEELSCFYFLTAFHKLTNQTVEINYLPATGTSNVQNFANLFLGWGLQFIIILDDEPSARKVFNSIKRDMFADDHDWASQRMYKINECHGIEDVFSNRDYKKFILEDESLLISGNNANSAWAKSHGASKAIQALKFMQKVNSNELKIDHLDSYTSEKITSLMNNICKRITNYPD